MLAESCPECKVGRAVALYPSRADGHAFAPSEGTLWQLLPNSCASMHGFQTLSIACLQVPLMRDRASGDRLCVNCNTTFKSEGQVCGDACRQTLYCGAHVFQAAMCGVTCTRALGCWGARSRQLPQAEVSGAELNPSVGPQLLALCCNPSFLTLKLHSYLMAEGCFHVMSRLRYHGVTGAGWRLRGQQSRAGQQQHRAGGWRR